MQHATFRFDVTPPLGHGCCGGWITPVESVDDELEALGVVLVPGGGELPVVLCTFDWTGLANEANATMRGAMAEAAGTTADRVSIHVVHPHNAPMACTSTEKLLLDPAVAGAPLQYGEHPLDLAFFDECLRKAREATAAAVASGLVTVAEIATGKAEVSEVASNRRVDIGKDGKIDRARSSSCDDPEVRALPVGTIDPYLRTVAFFGSDQSKLASMHFYATHPMSYYGDGVVTADFAGLARKQRQAEEPHCCHLYFNGCGGNIGAGKYNDGTPPMRPVLQQRIYDAIVASESDDALQRQPWDPTDPNASFFEWRSTPLAGLASIVEEEASLAAEAGLLQTIGDAGATCVERNRAAYEVVWLRRARPGSDGWEANPLLASSLTLNDAVLLCLPGELFVEYQLHAQSLRPDAFVATAAYADNGLWYVPTASEYPKGGYEAGVTFAADRDGAGAKTGCEALEVEFVRAIGDLMIAEEEEEEDGLQPSTARL